MSAAETTSLQDIVKALVRDTLGCSCPDEVFDDIEIEPRQVADDGSHVHRRMVIGERLLIYVLEEIAEGEAAYLIDDFIHAGRGERDSMGYNRFRLVLTSSEPKPLMESLETHFKAHSAVDDRVHLHVLKDLLLHPLNLATG